MQGLIYASHGAIRTDNGLLNENCSCNTFKHERPCLTTFPNTEKRVENTTRSGVFLTNFEVFGNVVKHRLECLIYLLNRN